MHFITTVIMLALFYQGVAYVLSGGMATLVAITAAAVAGYVYFR